MESSDLHPIEDVSNRFPTSPVTGCAQGAFGSVDDRGSSLDQDLPMAQCVNSVANEGCKQQPVYRPGHERKVLNKNRPQVEGGIGARRHSINSFVGEGSPAKQGLSKGPYVPPLQLDAHLGSTGLSVADMIIMIRVSKAVGQNIQVVVHLQIGLV